MSVVKTARQTEATGKQIPCSVRQHSFKKQAWKNTGAMHRSLLISSLVLGSSCFAVAQEAVQSSSDIRFQECKADLLSADEDNDLLLRADEYLTFLNTFGPGDEQYDDLDDLPLSLLSTYVFSACFCTAFSNDPDCCVGPNAAVNMDEEESDLISMNLISFCRGVDKALGGSSPTPAPPAPSNSPTLFPTMGPNPTNSPTTSPTIADVPTFSKYNDPCGI